MSERLFDFPESIFIKTAEVSQERIIQSRDVQLQLQLGAYAMALSRGETEGLIGSDIFPDDCEGF